MILAIGLALAYFNASALKKHFKSEWSFQIDVEAGPQAPAFALFGNYNDAASANFTTNRLAQMFLSPVPKFLR
jgi:hypothetical protein